MNTEDTVTGKTHYHRHPSGIECWELAEMMNFNLGNALKYVWRYRFNGKPKEDLLKAANYLEREANRDGAGHYRYPVKWYEMMKDAIRAEEDSTALYMLSALFGSAGLVPGDPIDLLRMYAVFLREKASVL